MSKSQRSTKRRRKAKRSSFFGGLLIEGLGIFAIIALSVFARQLATPDQPSLANSNELHQVSVEKFAKQHVGQVHTPPSHIEPQTASTTQWRSGGPQQFENAWHGSHRVRFPNR